MVTEAAARHREGEPSPWVERFAPLVPAHGAVLDLACGGGRHGRLFLARGHAVTLIDRDLAGVSDLGRMAQAELVAADLEAAMWPCEGRSFAAIVVVNYLHRPLFRHILAALEPAGVLIYETFAAGNEALGRPRNPDFLLQPGELLDLVRGTLRVVAYEHGRVEQPRPAIVQRIAAVGPAAGDVWPLPESQ